MKFIKRSDLFFKTGSNDLPLDSNVTNFVSIDRTRVYGGIVSDKIYGTISHEYPISIVPEIAIHTTSSLVSSFLKNDTIVLDGEIDTPELVFSSVGNVLLATVTFSSEVIEIMSFPGTIESFHVFEAPTTLIAVLESDHLYIFALTLNGENDSDGTDKLHNSFRISRFTRVSRKEIPLTDYTIIEDGSDGLKVICQTENVRDNYDAPGRDAHIKIKPIEKSMDLDPMRHGGMEGYIYLDNSLETAVVDEVNVKWDLRYRTSAEGFKYIWIKVRDQRGIPMASQTLSTIFYSDLDLSGTLAEDDYGDLSAYMTMDDHTPTTDTYGIAEIDVTYVKSSPEDNIWIEFDIVLGSIKKRMLFSRRHTAAEVA